MAFTPTTEIRLLSVNFENDYKNVVAWASLAEQESEMLSCSVKTCREFTYQRKDNIIRVPYHIDELYNCNYVMYKNKSYTDKWFYAFISDMTYINDGRTDIKIETDVWGTWWNNINVKPSFVEREHTDNDTFGRHTYPEGLETGEYIVNGDNIIYDQFLQDEVTTRSVILAVSEDVNGDSVEGRVYGGAYSGVKYIPFYLNNSSVTSLNQLIEAYGQGKTTAIQCLFTAPSCLINIDSSTGEIASSQTPINWNTDLGKAPTSIDGYTPRNKKLLCYPYSFLVASNNQGSSAIYHNEKFYNGGDRIFENLGVLCPGCSIRTYPSNYNNDNNNYDEGINLGKFPICNWTGDVFTNWLTQNSVNVGTQLGSGALQLAAGLAVMGLSGGVAAVTGGAGLAGSGLSSIIGAVGQMRQHDVMPDQSYGNLNCGDVTYAGQYNTFKFTDMCIKAEYARIIDDFFDRYGYKINRVKTPLKNHRPVWWFTKTIAANIDGAIPQDDLTKIRNIYDNGVTFWKVHSQVEHYELDNTI